MSVISPSSTRRDILTTSAAAGAAALLAATGSALPAAQAQLAGVKRTDLQQHDLSIPGRELVQVLVTIPPGVTAARHTHPGEEIVNVVEGALEYALDGRPPVTLKAGDALFIPHSTAHAVKNVGSGNATELATYIVEKGKPLVTLVE